jgi:hypothetical protein
MLLAAGLARSAEIWKHGVHLCAAFPGAFALFRGHLDAGAGLERGDNENGE